MGPDGGASTEGLGDWCASTLSGEDAAVLGLEEFLVAVADRHFGDVRHLGDLRLGHLLVGEERGGVHRGRGEADGRLARVDPFLLGVAEELARLTLGLVGEVEVAGEARDVLLGVGGFDLELELADDVAVGAGDLVLIDAGEGGDLVERTRSASLAGGGV